MATKVLDSWPLIAFFQGEPSAPEVKKILVHAETGRGHLLMTVVNWGEVYYNIMRRTSQAELITGDPDFKAVQGEIKIGWLK